MMKQIVISIALMLIAATALAGASTLTACLNSQNSDCLPADSSCKYGTYMMNAGGLEKINETYADFDQDSWDDACDAFPADSREWFDADADGVGHNKDCDDFDSSNVFVCTGESSHRKQCAATWSCTEWTNCTDGARSRTCTKTNNCDNELNKPDEYKGCPNYVILKETTKAEPPTENKTGEEPKAEQEVTTVPPVVIDVKDNHITGNSIWGWPGKINTQIILGILAIIIVAIIFLRNRKK